MHLYFCYIIHYGYTMKNLFLLSIFMCSYLVADSSMKNIILSANAEKTMQAEENVAKTSAEKSMATQTVENNVVSTSAKYKGTSDVMIVDPKVVAQDWVSAFNALLVKKVSNISFAIEDEVITNVTSIEPLPGGYLLLFTMNTTKGNRYKIVKTSSINSISTK